MQEQSAIDFNRIKSAIEYLDTHYKQQPSLDEVAAFVHLSPAHFQRMFTAWAGVSPKQFLLYTTASYAKQLLKDEEQSLFDSSIDLGLSSPSRLHDLFVSIEAMTPGEYKDGGRNLKLNYQIMHTLFGKAIIVSTTKGICELAFIDDEQKSIQGLYSVYTHAEIINRGDDNQQKAISLLSGNWSNLKDIKLHLRGTNFQLKVWEALLKIPLGKLTSYGTLANEIGNAKASRAVGTAIGSNPIAYLIPCHRVIQNSGAFGGYRWDVPRKKAIIGWEGVQVDKKIRLSSFEG